MPEVDHVHVWRSNRFSRRGRFGWILSTFWWGLALRRRHVDLAIDVRGEFPLALILWLCGARQRVGWQSGGGGFLLTHSPRYVPNRPEVASRLALLAELGIRPEKGVTLQPSEVPNRPYGRDLGPKLCLGPHLREAPLRRLRIGQAKQSFEEVCSQAGAWEQVARKLDLSPFSGEGPPRPAFRPTEQARQQVAQRLDKLAAESPSEGPPILLHVGAGTEAKQWPAEHWRELAGRLVVEHGRQVVLVGGVGDRIIARRIVGPRPWPGLADWTGRLGVVELAALTERAELLVGADSGPAHLAAAVGTPVVVLFSGTNRARQWQPRGERVTVLRHPVDCSPCHRHRCALAGHPCMRGLCPETVLEAVLRQIAAGEKGHVTGRKGVRR